MTRLEEFVVEESRLKQGFVEMHRLLCFLAKASIAEEEFQSRVYTSNF